MQDEVKLYASPFGTLETKPLGWLENNSIPTRPSSTFGGVSSLKDHLAGMRPANAMNASAKANADMEVLFDLELWTSGGSHCYFGLPDGVW